MDTPAIEQPTQPLSVTLTMTPDLSNELRRCSGVMNVARAYEIDSPDAANLVNDELKATKARIVRLKELKAGFVAPAKQIIANAEGLFDGPINENIEAEKHYKGLLTGWTAEQQRRADEARRKAEEEARKARQEAEAKAAAERAKAEEAAREQRRIAQEAEERRRKAEAEGNARAAARAAAEAAQAAEKAAAVVENAEAKAQQTVMAAAAAPVAEIPAVQKLDGFSSRESWTAQLKPGTTEEQAILEICHEIAAGRRDLAALLKLDMSAAAKLAKALKSAFSVPCMMALKLAIAASRK